jgi:hypothetical protein
MEWKTRVNKKVKVNHAMTYEYYELLGVFPLASSQHLQSYIQPLWVYKSFRV